MKIESYKRGSLWINAFGARRRDQHEIARSFFAKAYEEFREKTIPLLAQISRAIPELTVHDISHIDALWEVGSTIAGDDYYINPAEAFVLGGAFLLHDAAMSASAFAEGISELRDSIEWKDSIARLYKASELSLPKDKKWDERLASFADKEALRKLHAKQAENLPYIKWGEEYLINDPVLRDYYGPIIGRIARSHWDHAHHLPDEFGEMLNPVAIASCDVPDDWTVDALKIACLLRVADAAHLDARRAPQFLRRLIKPTGHSDDHWEFQGRLGKPRRDEDGIVYTAGSPFPEPSSSAWWLCFDAVSMVDTELRAVDAVLQNEGKSNLRMACRRVIGAERPEDLCRHIKTVGWTPIDTTLKVTDIGALAKGLGGKRLYGHGAFRVPLRELMQNAADSVRARRALPDGGIEAASGEIVVRLRRKPDHCIIEIDDNGVGMSPSVLCNDLIDFGRSFWRSSRVEYEFPGLAAADFQPTGRFGIGFFSAFMWGDHVTVYSRKYKNALDDTCVLDFKDGVANRPIFRMAKKGEVLPPNVSTRIVVHLNFDPFTESEGREANLFYESEMEYGMKVTYRGGRVIPPARVIAAIAPAIDVNIYFQEENGERTAVISANDWKTINAEDFINRIYAAERISEARKDRIIEFAQFLLRPILDEKGEVLGRGILAVDEVSGARLVTNGLWCSDRTAEYFYRIFGVLFSEVSNAARDAAVPLISRKDLARWAEEQVLLLLEEKDKNNNFSDLITDVVLAEAGRSVMQMGGQPHERLPLWTCRKGYVFVGDFAQIVRDLDCVIVTRKLATTLPIELHENVFSIATYSGDWEVIKWTEEYMKKLGFVHVKDEPVSVGSIRGVDYMNEALTFSRA